MAFLQINKLLYYVLLLLSVPTLFYPRTQTHEMSQTSKKRKSLFLKQITFTYLR